VVGHASTTVERRDEMLLVDEPHQRKFSGLSGAGS
jgi:hypothetical protein